MELGLLCWQLRWLLPLELFCLTTCFASVRSLVASLKTVVLDGEVVLITPRNPVGS